jgi:hypothetical protein
MPPFCHNAQYRCVLCSCRHCPSTNARLPLFQLSAQHWLQRCIQVASTALAKEAQLARALLCVTARCLVTVNGNTTQPLASNCWLVTAQQFYGQTCSCNCSSGARAQTTNPHACSHTKHHTIYPISRFRGCTPNQHPTHLAKTSHLIKTTDARKCR